MASSKAGPDGNSPRNAATLYSPKIKRTELAVPQPQLKLPYSFDCSHDSEHSTTADNHNSFDHHNLLDASSSSVATSSEFNSSSASSVLFHHPQYQQYLSTIGRSNRPTALDNTRHSSDSMLSVSTGSRMSSSFGTDDDYSTSHSEHSGHLRTDSFLFQQLQQLTSNTISQQQVVPASQQPKKTAYNSTKTDQSDDDSEAADNLVCNACGFESVFVSGGLLSCPHCKQVYYCSTHCLGWDWKNGGHSKVCIGQKLQFIKETEGLHERKEDGESLSDNTRESSSVGSLDRSVENEATTEKVQTSAAAQNTLTEFGRELSYEIESASDKDSGRDSVESFRRHLSPHLQYLADIQNRVKKCSDDFDETDFSDIHQKIIEVQQTKVHTSMSQNANSDRPSRGDQKTSNCSGKMLPSVNYNPMSATSVIISNNQDLVDKKSPNYASEKTVVSSKTDTAEATDFPKDSECCKACGFDAELIEDGLVPCPHCKEVFYCSTECMDWDWKTGSHGKQCSSIIQQQQSRMKGKQDHTKERQDHSKGLARKQLSLKFLSSSSKHLAELLSGNSGAEETSSHDNSTLSSRDVSMVVDILSQDSILQMRTEAKRQQSSSEEKENDKTYKSSVAPTCYENVSAEGPTTSSSSNEDNKMKLDANKSKNNSTHHVSFLNCSDIDDEALVCKSCGFESSLIEEGMIPSPNGEPFFYCSKECLDWDLKRGDQYGHRSIRQSKNAKKDITNTEKLASHLSRSNNHRASSRDDINDDKSLLSMDVGAVFDIATHSRIGSTNPIKVQVSNDKKALSVNDGEDQVGEKKIRHEQYKSSSHENDNIDKYAAEPVIVTSKETDEKFRYEKSIRASHELESDYAQGTNLSSSPYHEARCSPNELNKSGVLARNFDDCQHVDALNNETKDLLQKPEEMIILNPFAEYNPDESFNGEKAGSSIEIKSGSTKERKGLILTISNGDTMLSNDMNKILKHSEATDKEVACNACGFEESFVEDGMLSCLFCNNVFYCSAECRDWHWSNGGHSSDCDRSSDSISERQEKSLEDDSVRSSKSERPTESLNLLSHEDKHKTLRQYLSQMGARPFPLNASEDDDISVTMDDLRDEELTQLKSIKEEDSSDCSDDPVSVGSWRSKTPFLAGEDNSVTPSQCVANQSRNDIQTSSTMFSQSHATVPTSNKYSHKKEYLTLYPLETEQVYSMSSSFDYTQNDAIFEHSGPLNPASTNESKSGGTLEYSDSIIGTDTDANESDKEQSKSRQSDSILNIGNTASQYTKMKNDAFGIGAESLRQETNNQVDTYHHSRFHSSPKLKLLDAKNVSSGRELNDMLLPDREKRALTKQKMAGTGRAQIDTSLHLYADDGSSSSGATVEIYKAYGAVGDGTEMFGESMSSVTFRSIDFVDSKRRFSLKDFEGTDNQGDVSPSTDGKGLETKGLETSQDELNDSELDDIKKPVEALANSIKLDAKTDTDFEAIKESLHVALKIIQDTFGEEAVDKLFSQLAVSMQKDSSQNGLEMGGLNQDGSLQQDDSYSLELAKENAEVSPHSLGELASMSLSASRPWQNRDKLSSGRYELSSKRGVDTNANIDTSMVHATRSLSVAPTGAVYAEQQSNEKLSNEDRRYVLKLESKTSSLPRYFHYRLLLSAKEKRLRDDAAEAFGKISSSDYDCKKASTQLSTGPKAHDVGRLTDEGYAERFASSRYVQYRALLQNRHLHNHTETSNKAIRTPTADQFVDPRVTYCPAAPVDMSLCQSSYSEKVMDVLDNTKVENVSVLFPTSKDTSAHAETASVIRTDIVDMDSFSGNALCPSTDRWKLRGGQTPQSQLKDSHYHYVPAESCPTPFYESEVRSPILIGPNFRRSEGLLVQGIHCTDELFTADSNNMASQSALAAARNDRTPNAKSEKTMIAYVDAEEPAPSPLVINDDSRLQRSISVAASNALLIIANDEIVRTDDAYTEAHISANTKANPVSDEFSVDVVSACDSEKSSLVSRYDVISKNPPTVNEYATSALVNNNDSLSQRTTSFVAINPESAQTANDKVARTGNAHSFASLEQLSANTKAYAANDSLMSRIDETNEHASTVDESAPSILLHNNDSLWHRTTSLVANDGENDNVFRTDHPCTAPSLKQLANTNADEESLPGEARACEIETNSPRTHENISPVEEFALVNNNDLSSQRATSIFAIDPENEANALLVMANDNIVRTDNVYTIPNLTQLSADTKADSVTEEFLADKTSVCEIEKSSLISSVDATNRNGSTADESVTAALAINNNSLSQRTSSTFAMDPENENNALLLMADDNILMTDTAYTVPYMKSSANNKAYIGNDELLADAAFLPRSSTPSSVNSAFANDGPENWRHKVDSRDDTIPDGICTYLHQRKEVGDNSFSLGNHDRNESFNAATDSDTLRNQHPPNNDGTRSSFEKSETAEQSLSRPGLSSLRASDENPDLPLDPDAAERSRLYRLKLKVKYILLITLLIALPLSIAFGVRANKPDDSMAPPNLLRTRAPTNGDGTTGPVALPVGNVPTPLPPTPAPVALPSENVPTTPLTPNSAQVFRILANASFDGGVTVRTLDSPQNKAFRWLVSDPNVLNMSESRIIQRFALASLYYSTDGINWVNRSLWLSEFDECTWYSASMNNSVCTNEGMMKVLDLGYNGLAGILPPEVGMLGNLTDIILPSSTDQTIGGVIPPELGALAKVEVVNLNGNAFFGRIPSVLGRWSKLQYMDLGMNQLSGSIPADLGNCTSLRVLKLSSNYLSGLIPNTIDQIRNLEEIILEGNIMTGELPSGIYTLTNLKVLNLNGNSLSTISNQLTSLTALETLLMSDNGFDGTLLTELGTMDTLMYLDFSMNNFRGPIPSEIGNLSNLIQLNLSRNRLTGTLPTQIGNLINLNEVGLNVNRLKGQLPSELGRLKALSSIRLEENDFTGTVPTEVCKTFSNSLPLFALDCGTANGQAQITCACCTYCCSDAGECECVYKGTGLGFLCLGLS